LLAFVAIVGLFGLCIGSFLNVVIVRVPAGRSVLRPRSACPGCETAIAWFDNVPVVSWLVLGGDCRRCGMRIPMRYPLVEALTAALFALVAALVGPVAVLPAVLAFVAGGVALAVIDVDCFRLPTPIVFATLGGVVGALVVAAVVEGEWARLVGAALGGVVLFVSFAAIAVAVPRGMGWGDVRLSAVLGVLLGWFGAGFVAFGTLASFLIGSITGVVAAVAAGRVRRVRIPFGPSMIVGALVAVLWGDPVLSWYSSSFA
jgi:leader peptidase (prepilin peptidase)/N-methyltransferase